MVEENEALARIKCVGVGGGGCNAVGRMVKDKVPGLHYIAVNTDGQALARSEAPQRIHIGAKLTRGLGAGGDPEIGRQAAEEQRDELAKLLANADMVFVTAGMGGGTGTGAAPVVADIARESGALTVAIVTKPFSFEGARRRLVAEEGLARLKEKVDTLIAIPNDRLLAVCDQKIAMLSAFRVADEVLRQGVTGIAELITQPGDINVDFADVRAVMTNAGSALMAIGKGSGENRAVEAAKAAITSPLLEVSIEGAKRVLFTVTGPDDLTLSEVHAAAGVITNALDPDASIFFGMVTDHKMENEVKITLIATGCVAREEFLFTGDRLDQLMLKPAPDDLEVPPFLRNVRISSRPPEVIPLR